MLTVAAGILALAGCGTIYVGNVSFTSVEVCSEELASRLHPHSGCLPVTRSENIQGFFFSRFRLQLSPSEAAKVAELSKLGKENGKEEDKEKAKEKAKAKDKENYVPSWIGRVFVANPGSNASQVEKWLVPATGNIEFLSLGDINSPPERAIETEIQFLTDFSGVVQKKIGAKIDLDPANIVESALGSPGVVAIPSALRSALVDKVAKIGLSRQTFDAAKGSYTYVSMNPPELDSLTNALALCGWSVAQAPDRQEQDTTGSGRTSTAVTGTGNPRSDCSAHLDKKPALSSGIKDLLKALESGARERAIKVVGIVIGVAILHTDRGRSEICSKREFGLVDRNTGETPDAGSCGDLWTTLKKYSSEAAPAAAAGAASAAQPASTPIDDKKKAALTDDQKKTILIAVDAAYSRAAYKAIDIQPHTSVLAIHWIPARIAK